jgi:hypothetical protein
MNALSQFLIYLVWPNPGNVTYGSPKMLALIVFCLALIVAAFVISFWRKKLTNQITKKLSRSWGTACFWFGFSGLILAISRVEQIQYVAMRLWWVVWIVIAVLYILIQVKIFRARHYKVIPSESPMDPRAKYLPKRKK